MTLEIVSANGTAEIIAKMTNSTFEITLHQGMKRENVSYSLMPRLNDGRLLAIKLNFKDARTVSA